MEDRPVVLVVDDVKANVLVLAKMITNIGCEVMTASSVVAAGKLIENRIPDIILTDLSMPEIDGFEFINALKENPATRNIPVIVISGYDGADGRTKGFEMGAVDFIPKPFDRTEVSLRITNHLKIYQIQKELELYNKKLNDKIEEQIDMIENEQKNILVALARLTDKRSGLSTYSHLENVSANSHKLALAMTLSPKFEDIVSQDFADIISTAALLHDIGQVAIPKEILTKHEVLTPEEEQLFQSHPALGAEILKEIYSTCDTNRFLAMAIDIAQSHQERWDGSGYPYGLVGEEIPLAARIVTIVGAFDEATHGLANGKEALTREEALDYIKEHSGTEFDPDIAKIFIMISNQIK